MSSSSEECSKLNFLISGSKNKKGPLPMKLRALPQSFWQQPNTLAEVPPTVYSSPIHDEVEQTTQSEVIGVPNTELLFSLFQTVEVENTKETKRKNLTLSKRGRPKKQKGNVRVQFKRDIDPYFNSATVPSIQVGVDENVCEKEKVLTMMSAIGESEGLSTDNFYSEKLSHLVVNL